MNSEYNKAFNTYLRGKDLSMSNRHYMDNLAADEPDSFTVPEDFQDNFKKALEKDCVFRRRGTVIEATESTGAIQTVVSTAVAEFVDEGDPIPEGSDQFTKLTFSSYKAGSIAKLSNTFIDDMHFDVEKYLQKDFARRFGRCEEKVFIQGTGTGEPKGIINSAEVGAVMLDDQIDYDDLFELYFSVEPEFRKNGSWLMSDATAVYLSTLKDDTGAYLLQENDTLLGKPVEISDFMDEAFPVAFGDFSYYWIIQRVPLSIKTLTELYANSHMTGYIGHERLDGKLIRSDAIKLLAAEEPEDE